MCRFPLLNDLHSFASQRATEGCERWLPVVVSKDEHHISLLPGANFPLCHYRVIDLHPTHRLIIVFICVLLDCSLIPGDELYPVDTSGASEDAKYTGPQSKEPQNASPLHRAVLSDPYTISLQITITPKYNHVLPVVQPAASGDSKSQL